MSLISMSGAWLSFSDSPLLDNTELHIEPNERVCLVGRNGAGKSTLMKIINREIPLDDGRIVYEQDLIVARLQQDPPRNVTGTVFDFVSEGVSEQAEHLKAYHAISHLVETDPSEKNLNKLSQVMEVLDHQGLWQLDSRINEVLLQLGLDADAELTSLSGGWLRKAALGRALVSSPKVLLLDEPTNHLDIESISWLEEFLKEFPGSIIFISHDRSFIRNMATRISISIAASWFPIRVTMKLTCWRKKKLCALKNCRTPSLIKNWRRKRCGSVRVSKPAVLATKAASAP